MLTILAILEDAVMLAERGETDWTVKLSDNLSGKIHTITTTDNELGAIMALATGLELPGELEDKLYEIAEPLFKECPTECRPIP